MANVFGYHSFPLLKAWQPQQNTFIMKNCVLISNDWYVVATSSSCTEIELIDCVFTELYDDKYEQECAIVTVGCFLIDFDINCIVRHPHYTNEYCAGDGYDFHSAAYGCDAGNCIDLNCSKTFYFDGSVVPYTTIFHGDIQPPTPTPTGYFSKTGIFCE